MHQRYSVSERLQRGTGGIDRGRISVEADHPAVGSRSLEQRPSVSAQSDGRVAVPPSRSRIEPSQRFFEQDGYVGSLPSKLMTHLAMKVSVGLGHGHSIVDPERRVSSFAMNYSP